MNIENHIGHRVEINKYGSKAVLECVTCSEELGDKPVNQKAREEAPAAPVCNDEEGCLMCGS